MSDLTFARRSVLAGLERCAFTLDRCATAFPDEDESADLVGSRADVRVARAVSSPP